MKATFMKFLVISCFLSTGCRQSSAEPTFGVLTTPTPTPVTETSTSTPILETPPLTPSPETPTPTPTIASTQIANISQPSSECFNGPSETYPRVFVIPHNTRVDIFGTNSDGRNWFLIDGVTIDTCWIRGEDLSDEFDLNYIPIVTTIITNTASICRTGPSDIYKPQTYIPSNLRVVVNGKNNNNGDWFLITPQDSTISCWVYNSLFFNTDTSSVPVTDTPLPPTHIPPTSTRPAGGGSNNQTPSGGYSTSIPSKTPIPPPTPTLCWPPGHCK